LPDLRPFEPPDTPAVYRVFLDALWDYMRRSALLTADDPPQPPYESLWPRYERIYRHLEVAATRAWVAVGADGDVVGYGRSIERDGHVELTEFFVSPQTQGAGIGRRLLERVFPLAWGAHRSILALLDPRAVSLYLRFGVRGVDTLLDLVGRPRRLDLSTDLVVEPIGAGQAGETAVVAIERAILGLHRLPEVRWLLDDRPAWVFRRSGSLVGYAFGSNGHHLGPIATLDPADLPTAIGLVEDDAAGRGLASVGFSVTLSNEVALRHLLGRGFRIDPFYVLVLSDEPTVDFRRYVATNPAFIL
jgi:GNAT superfamily N-acetyltransferase